STTLHGLEWFEVLETRGSIDDGTVREFQVTMKIGFRLDD
ncbi:MAG: dodecin family protein, partial [Acidimicrobiia bacterium]